MIKPTKFVAVTIALNALLALSNWAQAQSPQCALEIAELNSPDAIGFGQFGISVSIQADRALIGMSGDDPNGLYSGSAAIFLRVGDSWVFDGRVVASDPAELEQFGAAVLIRGNTAFVGAPFDDNAAGVDAGAVYVFERSAGSWQQTAKLIADQPSTNFGGAMAVEGDTLVIAAQYGFVSGIVGATYVFERIGNLWQQQARIVGDASTDDSVFGFSVALEGDLIAIGSSGTDETSKGLVRVYQRDGSAWPLAQLLSPSTLEPGDHFGYSVAIHDRQLLVGAPGDSDFSTSAGRAYVFAMEDGAFEQIAELRSASSNPNDRFGFSVALDADRALVSAVNSDTGALGTGSVSVFRRGLRVWTEVATLNASDANPFGAFGWSVALAGDTGLVGALHGDGGVMNSGSAYVIDIPVPEPSVQAAAKLLDANGVAGDEFGSHIAISDRRMLITAPKHAHAGNSQTGLVQVFHDAQGDGNWLLEKTLTPQDPARSGVFGFNADIKSDLLITGSFHAASVGAAYVFRNTASGWQPEATLTASDGAIDDRFGFHVAICNDIAVVGARDADLGGTLDNGAAYVFGRQANGWNEIAKLTADDAPLLRGFGTSVAANCDTIMVGAPNVQAACQLDPNCSNSGVGSVYVYQRVGDEWIQTQTLSPSDGQKGDAFGYWVDVSGDVAIIGAWLEDDNGNTDNGAAYIFRQTDGLWQQEAKLRASDASSSANFGLRVAISGNAALVPARRADGACGVDPNCDSGAVYLFYFDGESWSEKSILTAADAAAGDWFGQHAAIAGTTVVVGSIRDDDLGSDSGSAYTFNIENDCGTLSISSQPGGCTPPPQLILYAGFE